MTTWPASNLPDESQAWRRKVEELLAATERDGQITRTNQVATASAQTSLARAVAGANLSIEEQGAAIVQSGLVPAPPENPSVTSDTYFDEYGVPRAAVFASCDPVSLDIDGNDISVTKFELHGRPNTVDGAWQKLAETQVVDIPAIAYSPLPAGEEWAFRLHAVSGAGVLGNPSAEVIITLAKDTTPPPQPATPTGESRLGQVTISTTGLTSGGQTQPADFAYFDVLMAATLSGVGASVGRMEGAGPNSLHVADQPYNVEQWYWLVGVDVAGNRSVDSDRIAVTAKSVADTDVSDELLQGITDAVTQDVSTNLGNTITWATVAPVTADGTGKPIGHLWYQKDGGDTIIGTWEWDGAAWQPRQFDNATLANLDAGKINAGYLDAARIDAKTITAEKLLIGNLSNMIADPTFIKGSAGWVAGASPGDSWAIGTPWSYINGGLSATITIANTGASPFLFDTMRSATQAGDKWAFGAVAESTTTHTSYIGARFLNAAGGYVSAALVSIGSAGSYSATTTTPAGAAYVIFQAAIPSAATGGKFTFANPYLRPATTGELLVDGAVTTRTLAANAVTANELAANAVTAGKINAGAIDGMVITGATVRTAASGQRVQLDAGGLKAYNSANAVTGQLSASSGGLTLSGKLRSGAGNQRAELESTQMVFYDPQGLASGSIIADNGGANIGTGYVNINGGDRSLVIGKVDLAGGGSVSGSINSFLVDTSLYVYGVLYVGSSIELGNARINGTHYPWAQAQGRVNVAASGVTTVTFPSGRFSAVPAIVASANNSGVIGIAHITGVSATSFEIRFFTYSGTQASATVSWIANQN